MASSLSSILHQPHGVLRHNIYRRCCCATLTIFHHHIPKPSSPRSYGNPRSTSLPPPLCTDFTLNLTKNLLSLHCSNYSHRFPGSTRGSLVEDTEVPSKGRIYRETYGCQMNVNDMEIVLSIMKNAGYREVVSVPESAEIIFINTCAIRDNAEHQRHWKSNVATGRSQSLRPPKVVVLG